MTHSKLFYTYQNYIVQERQKTLLESSFDSEKIQTFVRTEMLSASKRLACYHYSDSNLLISKEYFFLSALFANYAHYEYLNDWSGYNVKPYVCALLSDHKELINSFSKLDVDIIPWVEGGTASPFNYAIRGVLRNDKQVIDEALHLYKARYDKGKQKLWSKNHILAIESILASDKNGLEKAIVGYEHGTIKKAMIRADICEEVLSFWGLLWGKIGWIKGINPIVDLPRVPLDLLEIKPLQEYTIPYWFLRDFYRQQGIDWRYDPVYPELQDWENDPENPDRKQDGFFKKLFS